MSLAEDNLKEWLYAYASNRWQRVEAIRPAAEENAGPGYFQRQVRNRLLCQSVPNPLTFDPSFSSVPAESESSSHFTLNLTVIEPISGVPVTALSGFIKRGHCGPTAGKSLSSQKTMETWSRLVNN